MDHRRRQNVVHLHELRRVYTLGVDHLIFDGGVAGFLGC